MPIPTPKKTKIPFNAGSKMGKAVDLESQNRKNQLLAGIERLDMKEKGIKTKQIINQNKLNEFKVKLLQDIFKLLQDNGVDPNDLSSINQFLQKLDEQNPDLRELFEDAFDSLLKTPHYNPMSPEISGEQPDLTSRFSNLQKNMMMPKE